MNTTKNMAQKLRDAKQRTGMSYEDIVARTEQNGEPVSLSTVRRVLGSGGADADFRYDTTLRPIANALGVALDEKEERTEDEDMTAAISMLKETYEARIADLRDHIVSLRRDKLVLAVVILLLFVFILYLFADGLHGNWGIFQYPVH